MTDEEDDMSPDGVIDLSTLVGHTMLIGLTHLDSEGNFESQEQLHGTVLSVDEHGVHLSLEGKRQGENWTMPPDARALQVAKPGVYTLRDTGETVVNPDFLARWTINRPPVKN